MLELVTEQCGDETYSNVPPDQYGVRAPGVCGGRPTFKHTRIEITGTLERLAAGETVEAIVAGYGGRIPPEAIAEASQIVTQQFLRIKSMYAINRAIICVYLCMYVATERSRAYG